MWSLGGKSERWTVKFKGVFQPEAMSTYPDATRLMPYLQAEM
jgi:hypothetical protein